MLTSRKFDCITLDDAVWKYAEATNVGYPYAKKELLTLFCWDPEGLFVIFKNEKPIGLFFVTLRTPEIGCIRSLTVFSEDKLLNYSGALLVRALKELKTRGARLATFFVGEGDLRFRKLLESLDFGEEKIFYLLKTQRSGVNLTASGEPSGIEIHRLMPKEIDKVTKIYLSTLPAEITHPSSEVASIRKNYPYGCFAATFQRDVIGSILALPKSSGVGWIQGLAVQKSFQRKGVGSFLLSSALRSSEKHSFSQASAVVAVDNIASLSLFSKFGFRTPRRLIMVRRRL